MSDPKELNGHKSEKLKRCYFCDEELDTTNGLYIKYVEVSRTQAFAAACCLSCKTGIK